MVGHFSPVRIAYVSFSQKKILIGQTSPGVPDPQLADERDAAEWDSILDEWDSWDGKVLDFINSHTGGAAYPIPDPKMNITKFNAQIRFMIQLYFCLSKFVNFYPTFVRSNATDTPYPVDRFGKQVQGVQELPQLNCMEILRLQRGLLRYELYCRLVGLPSMALSCNPDVYYALDNRALSSVRHYGNRYIFILPVDEAEEVICASLYVRSLYYGLRFNLFENLHKHILDSNLTRGQDVHAKYGRDTKEKTASHWLSQTDGRVLDFFNLAPYCVFDWTKSMSRLGLGFLDRVIRSSVSERRDLMRSALNKSPGRYGPGMFWRTWDECEHEDGFELGPHCNPMILTVVFDFSVSELISDTPEAQHRLRSLGWVFFDDDSKLHALGLPHDAKASTIRKWVKRTHKQSGNSPPLKPAVPDSVLAARFTEDEWKELVMKKYSPRDRRGHYQAMSRFVAGARAVVDFTSTQLPQIN